MITPKDLVIALNDGGVSVSERTLTDWRQKHLLPPLKTRGLGRAKGTIQAWDIEEILPQAFALHFYLKRYSRAEAALLNLWLAGFEVPVEKARKQWLKNIEWRRHKNKKLSEKHPKGEYGLFNSWAKQILRRLTAKRTPQSELVKEFAVELLNSTYNEKYEIDDEFISGVIDSAINHDNSADLFNKIEESTKFAKSLFQKILPLNNFSEIISNASKLHLIQANNFLNIIRKTIYRFAEVTQPELSKYQLAIISAAMTNFLAPFTFICHLKFQEHEIEEPFEETAQLLFNFCDEISENDFVRLGEDQIEFSEDKKEFLKIQMANIWGE